MLNAAWIVAVALALRTAPVAPPQAPAPAEWPDDRPVTHFVQNLGHDAARLPSVRTAALTGGGLVGVAVTHGSDQRLSDWAGRAGHSSYSGVGRLLGDGWVQGGGAVSAYAIGRLTRQPAVTHIGSDLIRAQALNAVVTTGLKVAVGRARPTGGSRAFPSGHSSATFASATILGDHFGWKVGVPAYAVSSFVAWTRVRDNQHWLSDVVFGATVGIIAGKTVTGTHRHAGWIIAPSVTRGGGALYFIKR